MKLDVVTIFPEYLEPLRTALLGKAIDKGLISVPPTAADPAWS
ncbi:tRNA (guanine-N(1)-)-methyltransferase (TrmD) [Mycobacteroides abscessus subsp. abscessus]|nr:tRNA (guanine-N(1)-)-methyltransferase (TrmD) [Mycobacteroides abscessus subsp. abscessus]